MKVRIGEVVQLIEVGIFFLLAWYFSPMMPDMMASHWGMNGEVNGWMPKQVAMYVMPCMATFTFIIFMVISRLEMNGRSIAEFRSAFEFFCVVFLLFLMYVYAMIIAWGMGIRFDMGAMLSPGFAVIMYAMGELLQRSKPNYFVGIRTRATIDNPDVWEKTHKAGARMFYIGAIVALFGAVFPKLAIVFIILPFIIITVALGAYASSEAKKMQK
jgi:uncharacterized membrane protein